MPLRSNPRAPSSPSGRSPLRHAPERSGRSLLAIGAVVVVLVGLVGVAIGAYVLSQRSYVATNAETLCPIDEPPAESSP